MAAQLAWKFHPERHRLLAEAHARPSTPAKAPLLAARIAALSADAEVDRAHMAALCRRIGVAEPGPDARWCALDAGSWRLRWERHTEVSTWSFFRPSPDGDMSNFSATALDLAPQDWLADLPGEILAAAHAALLRTAPASMVFAEEETIGSMVAGGIQVFTDFRPGPDSFTRFILVQPDDSTARAGRILQQLFEIETYRLLALMAFPLAGETAGPLSRLEAEAYAAALKVSEEGGVAADRQLLSHLAALAGEAEALASGTSFRFSASRAYDGLVRERIGQLNETVIPGRPTIGEFMERRLAPAMRTCAAVADRQTQVIARIARTAQMLNTRVEVAAEEINVGLLASMNRRAQMQLRIQETVEGLSVAAISYYALALLKYGFEAVADVWPSLNPTFATGLAAPIVVLLVWRRLHGVRAGIHKEPGAGPAPTPDPAP